MPQQPSKDTGRPRLRQFRRLGMAGISSAASLAVILSVCVVAVAAISSRQPIYDWYKLRGYKAPDSVANLATQDAMTPYARKVLYVNTPKLQTKNLFVSSCPKNGGEQSIILGCYHGGQGGVFLLDVTDPRLDGVEQVTIAHEMLHAAYDRLSSGERRRVNAMLQDYYDHGLTDPRIKKTIDAYRRTEPTELQNEMHSIFGTEVSSLPVGLEDYYKKYFADRAQVAGFASRYQGEFSSRQAQIADYDGHLSSLKAQIQALEASLQAKQQKIESSRNNLVAARDRDVSAYNAGVPVYNSLIDSYNADVRQLQTMISNYNSTVAARNAVALEEDELVNELSSNVQQQIK